MYPFDVHELSLPVFCQDWWLDAVCGKGNWKAGIVTRADGEVLGVLPYYLKRKAGFRVVCMPPFTPYLGVWLNEKQLPQKRATRYHAETRIIRQLVAQLPKTSWFSQVQLPGFENHLPFHWQGYRVAVRCTYTLPPAAEKDVWQGLSPGTRNRIRKARQLSAVLLRFDFDEFVAFYNRCMQRQALEINGRNEELLRALHQQIAERKQGAILGLKNKEGQPLAMVYQLWDEHVSYYWMPALDKNIGAAGSAQLLIYELIKHAHQQGRTFNFEGSMLPHVEPVFRAFGARRLPVFHLYKAGSRLLYAAKELLGK